MEQEIADGIGRRFQRPILGMAVGIRSNHQKSNALASILDNQFKRISIAEDQHLLFSKAVAIPYMVDSVNDKLAGQYIASGYLRFADFATSEYLALGEKLGLQLYGWRH